MKMVIVSIVNGRVMVADSTTEAENQIQAIVKDFTYNVAYDVAYGGDKTQKFTIRTIGVELNSK